MIRGFAANEAVALSGDNRFVVTGSQDKTAILWDASSGKKLQNFGHPDGGILSVAVSGDGKFVLTGSQDKTAILWEVKAAPQATGKKFTNSLNMKIALVPRGKSWLGGGGGKEGTTEVNIPQTSTWARTW